MVAKTVNGLEHNVAMSFGYVKKDLLAINDAVSDLYDKIQHLGLNHAALLEKIASIEKQISPKEKEQEVLDFYDLKNKKKFKTSTYKIKKIKGRNFAVAKSPDNVESYRAIPKKKKTTPKKIKKVSSKPVKKIIKETTVFEN